MIGVALEQDGYRLTVPFSEWAPILALAWFYVENQGLDVDDATMQALEDEERGGKDGVVCKLMLFVAMREPVDFEQVLARSEL